MVTERVPQRLWHVSGWALRLVTAGALAVSAFVHADLAARYQLNRSGGLSQGELFQIEAGVTALAALLVLLSARRLVWALAFGVAASALAAVLISANYDIGPIGPIPDMYEPLWYPEKTLTAVFEAVAVGTSLLGFLLATAAARTRRRRPEIPQSVRHRVPWSPQREPHR